MTEVTKNIYCDILSEHDGQKVPGASTIKDIVVMAPDEDDDESFHIERISLDMCPACYAKYAANLFVSYDNRRRATYSFSN